jgi:uncharacterized protein
LRARALVLALLSGSALVPEAFVLPAFAQDNPMRVIIYNTAPVARPAARPATTYRARRRYEAPKLPVPPGPIVPEFLPDGTPNPDYKPPILLPGEAGQEVVPAQPPVPIEKRPVIALVGDSLAEALSLGLEADSAFKMEFTLKPKTVSASGLVRDDFHDWPRTVGAMLKETPAPQALVLMVGLNDRQILRVGNENHAPLSPAWREAYNKRIDAVISAAKSAKVPLVWVGLPTMRTSQLSHDLAQINAMVRDRVSAAGETFVETFDGFADASGSFSATGPDIIGDTVRLRGPDGIHFTPAGQRKLAFFVDKPLRKRLENLVRPASLPEQALPATAPAAPGGQVPGQVSVQVPGQVSAPLPAARATPATPLIPTRTRADIGEIRLLNTPPSAPTLAGVAPPHQDPATEALFGQGLPPAPRAGRADDYRWK